ncbi:hypothetical protein ABIA39_007224 [Nocardia sp. GAS34]|uniref:hypothetical protein n=1 Tax=unclassified Nocardia TaxID=2637762 RepID=UPI003D263A9C
MTFPPGSGPHGGDPAQPSDAPVGESSADEQQDASWWETRGKLPEGDHTTGPQDAPAWGTGTSPQQGWAQSGGAPQAAPGFAGAQAQPYDAGWGQTAAGAQPGYQQPAYQQPGYQSGWNAQPGYPGGLPATPQRRTGLIVGIAVGVVALLVIGVALVVTFTSHDSTPTAAPKPPVAPATGSATPSSTSSSAAPTAPASSGHLSYTEYAKNWNFTLDSVQLHADWVQGRDDSTCVPVESGTKFTDLGCRYTAELVYRAEGGALMLTQFVMGMSDPAKAAAAVGKYSDSDLKLRPGTYLAHFAVGKWQGGAQGQFLVTTLVTATSAVPEATAAKYLHYMQADMVSALMWR